MVGKLTEQDKQNLLTELTKSCDCNSLVKKYVILGRRLLRDSLAWANMGICPYCFRTLPKKDTEIVEKL